MDDQVKYCQRCGTKMKIDAAFCPQCGTPSVNPQAAQPQQNYQQIAQQPYPNQQPYQTPPMMNAHRPNPRKRRVGVILIVILVIVLALAGGGYYAYDRYMAGELEVPEFVANIFDSLSGDSDAGDDSEDNSGNSAKVSSAMKKVEIEELVGTWEGDMAFTEIDVNSQLDEDSEDVKQQVEKYLDESFALTFYFSDESGNYIGYGTTLMPDELGGNDIDDMPLSLDEGIVTLEIKDDYTNFIFEGKLSKPDEALVITGTFKINSPTGDLSIGGTWKVTQTSDELPD